MKNKEEAKKGGKKEKDGGSEFVKVTTTLVEELPPEEPKEVGLPSEAELLTNKVLIEVLCDIISKVTILITKIDELAFDEQEVGQLQDVWSPILPTMSPLALALVTTAIIVSSKLALYITLKKRPRMKEKEEESVKETPEEAK